MQLFVCMPAAPSTHWNKSQRIVQAEDVEAWPGLPAGLKMEVGSPFTWLCQAPRRLVVPQRMPGAPKIWTLPRAKLDPLAKGLKVGTGQTCRSTFVKGPWQQPVRGAPRLWSLPRPKLDPLAKGLKVHHSRGSRGCTVV